MVRLDGARREGLIGEALRKHRSIIFVTRSVQGSLSASGPVTKPAFTGPYQRSAAAAAAAVVAVAVAAAAAGGGGKGSARTRTSGLAGEKDEGEGREVLECRRAHYAVRHSWT
jgi:hypothetical protein